jgi:TolA-binding protein
MVVPEAPRVRLVWRRVGSDWLGILLSLSGGALLVLAARSRSAAQSAPWAERLERLQPVLLSLALVPLALLTLWNTARMFGPDYFYKRGWSAFEKERYDAAIPDFERAMRLGGASPRAAEAAFFRAASLFRANRNEEARAAYQYVIDHHPDSVWVAESHYHVGLALLRLGRPQQARARFEQLIAQQPENRWAKLAAEELQKMERPGG